MTLATTDTYNKMTIAKQYAKPSSKAWHKWLHAICTSNIWHNLKYLFSKMSVQIMYSSLFITLTCVICTSKFLCNCEICEWIYHVFCIYVLLYGINLSCWELNKSLNLWLNFADLITMFTAVAKIAYTSKSANFPTKSIKYHSWLKYTLTLARTASPSITCRVLVLRSCRTSHRIQDYFKVNLVNFELFWYFLCMSPIKSKRNSAGKFWAT